MSVPSTIIYGLVKGKNRVLVPFLDIGEETQ